VRGEIVAAIEKQRGEELARKAGTEAVEQLKSGATTWEKAVSALEVDAQGPNRSATDPLPVELRNALFMAPKPTADKAARHFQTVPLGTGDFSVMALSGSRLEAMAETPEQRQVRVRQATGRVATGEIVGYLTQIRSGAEVDKNPKAFE
jgi:hypothetical protein